MTQSFVRKRGNRLIGHANVRIQLGWYEGVQLVITHGGSEMSLAKEPQQTAGKCGIEAFIGGDGMTLDAK